MDSNQILTDYKDLQVFIACGLNAPQIQDGRRPPDFESAKW